MNKPKLNPIPRKDIPITKEILHGSVTISTRDSDLLALPWRVHKRGYVVYGKRIDGHYRLIYMHREIAQRMGIDISNSDIVIDHANRDKTDNRRENLRVATKSQNMQNKGGVIGVSYNRVKGCWTASVQVDNRRIFVGNYQSAEEARYWRNEAAKQLHDRFYGGGTESDNSESQD